MSISVSIHPSVALHPLSALQQKARRRGYHVFRAANFAAYRDRSAEGVGHVLIYDRYGALCAGPLDVEAADWWLAEVSLARIGGQL